MFEYFLLSTSSHATFSATPAKIIETDKEQIIAMQNLSNYWIHAPRYQ